MRAGYEKASDYLPLIDRYKEEMQKNVSLVRLVIAK